jgi:MFS family permease
MMDFARDIEQGFEMDAFTIVTGIAGLLGLLLQLRDAFPEHRETRKSIVMIVLGIFIGSLIASLLNSKFSVVAIPLSPFALLITGFGAVLSALSIAAILSSDRDKRGDLLAATGIGLFAFMFVLLFGAMLTSTGNQSTGTHRRLTVDEFIQLSAIQAGRNNYDRAIQLLEDAGSTMTSSDPRYSAIKKRIEDLKAKQLAME